MIWVDAHISPGVVAYLNELKLEAVSFRQLGLLHATDQQAFDRARESDAIVLTKDADFVTLLRRHGPPPKVIWLRCGNTTNHELRNIFEQHLELVLNLLTSGEVIVEISG